jgi:hypothetical protein
VVDDVGSGAFAAVWEDGVGADEVFEDDAGVAEVELSGVSGWVAEAAIDGGVADGGDACEFAGADGHGVAGLSEAPVGALEPAP